MAVQRLLPVRACSSLSPLTRDDKIYTLTRSELTLIRAARPGGGGGGGGGAGFRLSFLI